MLLRVIEMKRHRLKARIIVLTLTIVSITVFISGCVSSRDTSSGSPAVARTTGGSFDNINPTSPQPNEISLSKGLLPRYHLLYEPTELDPTGQGAFYGRKGNLGSPVPNIDQRPGAGKVFGSGQTKTIGVELTGFIHFPLSGSYTFKALINDAARIFIGGKMIINDPTYGSNRYAGPSSIEIRESGFYEFKAQYYQRKGTSAFQLFWKKPNSNDFEIVPSEAFFHRP